MKSLVRRNPKRLGIEVVEFALVLPLFVMLIFGTIEAARAVMVAHSMQEAAQAGCRVYSVKGTPLADASTIISKAMTDSRVTNYSVVFSPATKEEVDVAFEPVKVTVTASFANVAWILPRFMSGKSLQGSCTLPADLENSDGGDANGYAETDDDNISDGILRDDDDDD